MRNYIYAIIVIILFTCNDENLVNVEQSQFSNLLPEETGITFINKVENSKDFNILNYRNFYNGGGVAIGDINNDNLPDIFLTSNMGENKLYLNKGDLNFEDISNKAGIEESKKWSTGVVMVDINFDGYLDIYVCNAGYQKDSNQENALYINNGDLTFKESAEKYGLNDSGYTTHAAFFDFDMDGDLDVYLLNNSFIPVNTLNFSNKREVRAKDWDVKDYLKFGGDKLLRNDDSKFVDISEEAGIYGSLIGFGLGVTVGDINDDNWPDIYVSNDFFERDYLYINNKNGSFTEDLQNRVKHISHSSMGADMADINNDGLPEIFVTDMLPLNPKRVKTNAAFDDINTHHLKLSKGFYYQYMHNTLQLNEGNGKFKEIAHHGNVEASDWSWGALMFDMNNDLYSDIFVCNGVNHDVVDLDFLDFFANDFMAKMSATGKKEELFKVIDKMPQNPIPNNVFKNNGDLTFSNVTDNWGFSTPTFSNGAAYGDLDNDGDLDLVINNVNQPTSIHKNNSSNNFISIQLKGKDKNTYAVGSKIYVYVNGLKLFREVIPSRGFQSSVDYTNVFGLANKEKIDSIVVVWPNLTSTKLGHTEINQKLVIEQSLSKKIEFGQKKKNKEYFQEIDHKIKKHQENQFIDFYLERNIPLMLSKEGPTSDVADVNNDGYMDIYIGGSAIQTGDLYVGGEFENLKNISSNNFKNEKFEETAVHFFDANNDGLKDLYLGSGGNHLSNNSKFIRDRFFLNKGESNFVYKPEALPGNIMNTSVVLSFDYNNDSHLDLFVCSRNLPQNYGIDPINYLFQNDGSGKFESVELPKNISILGMIRDGSVLEQTEGYTRLIVVGDWMSPTIIKFVEGNIQIEKNNLSDNKGFWGAIEVSDIDGDGDEDFVLGNLGTNSSFRADENNPLKLFINDYDKNGQLDKVLTNRINNKDIPIFSKRDLADQLPTLKKKFLLHKDFAGKSVQELFGEEQIRNSVQKSCNYFKSCVAINNGNYDNFDIKSLPAEVQLSNVNDILAIDIDVDGDQDLILGGNYYEFLPQFSRLDASRGDVLFNDGEGRFSIQNNTGFEIEGQLRELQYIENSDQRFVIALLNNEMPKLFRIVK